MLFREGHSNLHFLWNGQYPITVTPSTADVWSEDGTINQVETEILTEATNNKRRQTFQVPGNKCRYIVVARGEFQEP